jgi:hypothetical protein
MTPTPNPSPQGGGEQTECAALLCVKSNGTRSKKPRTVSTLALGGVLAN